ncbi:MAG TPA: 2-isopropylmalate synthase [Clostridia bacterium]|nr:MAG: 2-isopropylmalate synthase [Firmicutes bacterium ADurb.Bin146]HOD93662.1 2-isopropylmalate synthase [Clostridia bacterium]HQM39898.1 2-isopropylmalate synthase [Clostridia bacterium]
MEKHIRIFDTTLRDGEQAPQCSMNTEEKIEIAKQLELMGVDCIEAGFPISSEGAFAAVEKIAKTIKESQVAALCRAVEKDIDAAWYSIKDAVSPRIHTFLATSPIHMEHKLKMSPDKVLMNIDYAVRYAKKYCSDVEFSAEDAMRSEKEFLVKAFNTAIKAGATVINVPDTVGYVVPEEMNETIRYLFNNVDRIEDVIVSVHCHNDLGMAVANSLAGVKAGALQVECTINGLGERAGNAALEEIVMALRTRRALFGAYTNIDTKQISRTSKLVYNIIGQTAPINKPIVGANAFAHESGIHQHGVLSARETYEIMKAEDLGIMENKLVIGRHSGKHAIADRLMNMGYDFNADELAHYYDKVKELSDKKKNITDSDLEAIINNKERFVGTYKLEHFDIHTAKNSTSACIIKLSKENNIIEGVSLGDGPINAAYNAINNLTGNICEKLINYSIHSVSDGNDALGEVTVKLQSKDVIVTGRGLSTNIIESSIMAYINGINKILETR